MTTVTITFTDTPDGLVSVVTQITDYNVESNAQDMAGRALKHLEGIAPMVGESPTQIEELEPVLKLVRA